MSPYAGIYYLGWGNFFMNITNDGVYDCSVDNAQTRQFTAMQLCHLEELYSKYDFSEIVRAAAFSVSARAPSSCCNGH